MKFNLTRFSVLAYAAVLVAGCQPTTGTSTAAPVSLASNANISLAQMAVAACQKDMPNNQEAVFNSLVQAGFSKRAQQQQVTILESSDSGVSVAITRSAKLEKLCSIAVDGMSAEQGLALVQPWVKNSNGVANEKLSKKAVAAWRGRLDGDLVFTSVSKESTDPKISGTGVRMIIIDR